jgi:ABC-type sugar transport system ATPase subunit
LRLGRAKGTTILYVSHRLAEVLRLSDRISVLRDGRVVGTLDRAAASEGRLVSMMLGASERDDQVAGQRSMVRADQPSWATRAASGVRLRVAGLSSPGRFEDDTFDLHAGEIAGLAGLVGAGRSDLAKALFGLDSRAFGIVEVDGRRLRPGRPRDAVRGGVGFIPEDRKRQGLIPGLSAIANHSLPHLPALRRFCRLDRTRERARATAAFEHVDLRAASYDAPVSALSGGNQQKVVLARWIDQDLKVLIADEPTRGVDVGAKAAIHRHLEGLAARGCAILLVSSDLPEVLRLAHRILVMREGRLIGELSGTEATADRVLRLMAGVE